MATERRYWRCDLNWISSKKQILILSFPEEVEQILSTMTKYGGMKV